MLVPFDEMPPSARIWIYQSNKRFSNSEIEIIHEMSSDFLNGWAAHGASLKSSFKVYHEKFLVISVDESYNQASGCSIDASVALVRNLEAELNINFFDRTRVCFMNNDEVFDSPMTDLKNLIETGKIKGDTLTFNNLVQNIEGLKNNWVIPAQESWLKRYF